MLHGGVNFVGGLRGEGGENLPRLGPVCVRNVS